MRPWENVAPFNWTPEQIGIMAGRAGLALWGLDHSWMVSAKAVGSEIHIRLWDTVGKPGASRMVVVDQQDVPVDGPAALYLHAAKETCAAMCDHMMEEGTARWADIQRIRQRVPEE